MSEQEYSDDPIERMRQKKRRLQPPDISVSQLSEAEELLARTDKHVRDSIAQQQRIRTQAHFANKASMTEDVVKRGQYMVAAGLARVFHYERTHRWSLTETKKGIFSRRERHEQEEEQENVYMEGNDD
jgi:hypothetical protein